MESGNKITKMVTVSTKKLKMMMKLKKAKGATRRKVAKSAGNKMRRTLFFFNVPAWINEYEELIEVFRPVSGQKG